MTRDVDCIGSAEFQNLTDPTTGLPCGYKLVDLTWTGKVGRGGPNVTMSGDSLSDIEHKLNDTQPGGFSWASVDGVTVKRDTHKKVQLYVLSVSLAKHLSLTMLAQGKIDCSAGGDDWVSTDPIDEGIRYLHGISGDCQVEKGFQVCARVSCSWNGGIWLCNDTRDKLSVPCRTIAEYTQDIRDKCWFDASPGAPAFIPIVRGQEFDDGNWNIIVGHSPEHC